MCTLGRVFERFTDRSRRVLVLAQEEARLLNHSYIGTEHILLGLIAEHEGIAAQALESQGISLGPVRARVETTIGLAGETPVGAPPFTPRAKKVLEFSLRESMELGHGHIGTEHLLLGLIREGDGLACQVLVSLGAEPATIRDTVIGLIGDRAAPAADLGPQSPTAGPFTHQVDLAVSPRCPGCRSDRALFRRARIDPDPDTASEPMWLILVYCPDCGTILGTLRDNGPPRSVATP